MYLRYGSRVTHGRVRADSQVCALTYGKENKRSLPASDGRYADLRTFVDQQRVCQRDYIPQSEKVKILPCIGNCHVYY